MNTKQEPISLPYTSGSILSMVLDIAEKMLICGAEINRVEDTIYRICSAYGAEHIEAFTIPSLITAEITLPNGDHSSMVRRVYYSENNLARIEELNALSREICESPIDPKEAKIRAEQTKYQHKYSKAFRYLGAMLATSSFTLFFGGNGFDMIATSIVAFVMTFYDFHKVKKFNRLLNILIPAFIGGSLSILLVKAGVGQNLDKVMIGSIMLLIPGIALGNSIRDLLCGDVISGAVRFLHSILLASAIALGYFTSIALFGGLVL